MLAVMLVTGIIALIDSIPYSIQTTYGYSREMVAVTPHGDTMRTARLLRQILRRSPVPVDREMTVRISSSQIKSIVGKWPFFMLGLARDDMRYYLNRQGSTGLVGRLPVPGAPEAVVSRPVAQNLHLKIGSIVQGPDLTDSYSSQNVRVVGIAQTDRWLMVNSIEYQRANHFPPVDVGMVFAKNHADQNRLDHWTDKFLKGKGAQAWAYFQIEKQTREMFETLFQLLNVAIATIAIVITSMMGMLMNIYQSQRLVEFGLLQAIGYTKRQLLRRVLLETISVVVLGWILGIAASYGMLLLAKHFLMDPSAYSMDIQDPRAFQYAIPIPLSILVCAVGTVLIRFRRFDPVGIVERRTV
jgi:ABC-type antimicrobial peptide transport system permease subunit